MLHSVQKTKEKVIKTFEAPVNVIVKETTSSGLDIPYINIHETRVAVQGTIADKDKSLVSIMVLGYNNLQKHTRHCIESILNYTADIDYELVLVDNGSSDGTLEYFKAVPCKKKEIIRITNNQGANFGVHLAIPYLTGRYIVIIANDVYVTRNWLANLIRCAESDSRIGFVATASDNISNLQALNITFESLEEMQLKAAKHNASDPHKWEERLRLMPAIAFYKRECLDIVGSLDYVFQHDFSDDDLSIRIRRAGYKLVFCGDVFVHHAGASVTGTTAERKNELLRMGRTIFRQKYFGVDAWDDLNNFEQLMLSLVNPEEKRGTLKPEVLGINVRCGTPILQLKNKLRHADIFNANLSAFVQNPKYWLDLKTICEGTVAVDRIEHLAEHFSPNSFDYILLGTPLNVYGETEKVLRDMLSLLKTDGQLLVKLRNQFDVNAFLDSMKKGLGSGQKSVTASDIDSLNKSLIQTGYSVQAVKKSLYNIDNSTKNVIRDVLRNSDTSQDIDAAFDELIVEEYALGIMKKEKIPVTTSLAQTGKGRGTSFDMELSAEGKSRTHTDITLSGENPLSCNFQHDTVVQGMTSIIILTQNGRNQTRNCVKSIRKHTPESHEIIFIDNGSTDGTVKWLHDQTKENKKYRAIENSENLGLAKGRNQGINISQGEFILLMDNNVIVGPRWLSGMLGCLNRVPAAGIVGPMTNSSKGLQQVADDSDRSVRHLDEYAAMFQEQNRHRTISSRNIDGFCMLFKRNMAEEIGLFDVSFDTDHFEDEDFCLRASMKDYQNYIAGDVFVHHLGEKECLCNRSVIDKKWTLSTASPEGKKLAVLKATELADNLYQRGKMDKAVEALINCIKLAPDAKEIYYELVRIFVEAKAFSEAWEVFESIPESARNDLKGLKCAGYIKEGLGLDDEAVIYADKMLSQDENYPAALNLKGVLAYKKGVQEKASDYFKKAIDADQGHGEPHTNLGVLLWGQDKKEEALANLRRGFLLSPTLQNASSLYYSVVSALNIHHDAENIFREACRLYPNNKHLAFLYIDILIQQDRFGLAMFKIEDALTVFGFDEGTLNAALVVREKLGPLQIEKISQKNSLSLCMIVKNEEDNLVKCLKSVRDIVDEMIIVDTGSTDKSKDIAKIFGAKIFDFPWTGDFSAARNHSLVQATGDWILILDADEVISDLDHKRLLKTIDRKNGRPVAFDMVTRNYLEKSGSTGWSENNGAYPQEEKGIGWYGSNKVRLFRNKKEIRFENPVHELLEASLREAKIAIETCSIPVHHYGRFDHDRFLAKGRDYYLLGKKKLEERGGGDYVTLRELAAQAGELSMFEEAIDLWQQVLAKRPDDVESLYNLGYQYMQVGKYQEALRASKKAVELSPEAEEALLNYALCEMLTGNVLKAKDLLEKFELNENANPTIMAVLGALHFISGNNGRGVDIFGKITSVNPAIYVNSLLEKLFASGQIEYANRLIDGALSFDIADGETLRLRAVFHN